MDDLDFDPALAVIESAPATDPDGALVVGTYDTGHYGNNFEGSADADGAVNFVFTADDAPVQLNVRGYDIDTTTEVAVTVNGAVIGFLEVTPDKDEGFDEFRIDPDLLQEGANVLSFVQTVDETWRWGVTDILLLDPGMNELPFDIDPEFTEDGYVTWQSDDGFYLGRMDLDTGGFLGVINHVEIPPINIFETIQAVEFIRTPDGIGAIGMSDQGLVYISEDEGYVLEGTEGLRFSLMPKGEVPGLRFIVYDAEGQYLYDEGSLTPLELNGGKVLQWLNEHEALVVNPRTGISSVLDVETMRRTVVTDGFYANTQAAAFTTSGGDQYISLQSDGYRDVFVNSGAGWEFIQRMVSPLSGGDELYSPEFFEWNDRVFMFGYVADELSFFAPTALALYDVAGNAWTQVSEIGVWKDPEAMVLNDGTLAFYSDDYSDFRQYFGTIGYGLATVLSQPGPDVGPDGGPDAVPSATPAPGAAYVAAGGGHAPFPFAPDAGFTPPAEAASRGIALSPAAPLGAEPVDSFVFRPLSSQGAPAAQGAAAAQNAFTDPFGPPEAGPGTVL